MTPLIRNSMVMGLTLLGVIWWVLGAAEDPMAMRLSAAVGCWLLAAVYWHITKPPRRD